MLIYWSEMSFFTTDSHLALLELINHAYNQASPEDVQSLQHHQQDIEQVVAEKGLELLYGQHQGGVEDSVSDQNI